MEENVQVSNTPENGVPESTTTSSGDDFFEALDTQVNSGILDLPLQEQTTFDDSDEQAGEEYLQQQSADQSPVEGKKPVDIENLQTRYSDSSREAKKLNSKLKELEPYMPILDAMREDPNLIQHVRNYFEGGGQAPVSMKEKLALPEEFVFDPDEAMSDPESDSARVLGATIDGVVQKRLNDTLSTQKAENIRFSKESAFRQKHEMSSDEWTDFVSFAKDKTLELEDIHYLMNRKTREQNIAKNANQEVSSQMRRVQQKPQSLASAGSQPEPQVSPEDKVFDEILGFDTKLDEAFGI
jgi:hypothetical protein